MKKLTIIAFVMITVAVVIGITGSWYGRNYLQQPLHANAAAETLLLEVKPGNSARTIVKAINTWRQSDTDRLDYRLSQLFIGINTIQAGVYEIQPSNSWRVVWDKLASGDEKSFAVTLVEGHTFAMWLKQLQQQPYLTATLSPELSAKSAVDALDFVQSYPSVEGLFLPETYHYRAGESDVSILRRAFQAMQQQLTNVWQQRSPNAPVNSPYELLILGSIIEKETGIAGERRLVASVFTNRLNKGMRLQSDPTTIYGINEFDGNLTRAHLREKTPFNTYRIDGLPPTPIAMVSVASITAAANPEMSDYYYFVADNSGGHVFSKTLKEHQAAVRRYQLNQSN